MNTFLVLLLAAMAFATNSIYTLDTNFICIAGGMEATNF